jgi:superfamily II DNA or RNA helicase
MTYFTFHNIYKNRDRRDLDNSFIIIDEAHKISNISITQDIIKIFSRMRNTKMLLLSATPVKNTGNDIIDLLNILLFQSKERTVKSEELLHERDYFNIDGKVDEISLKEDKIKELSNRIFGYVSYLSSNNELTFA